MTIRRSRTEEKGGGRRVNASLVKRGRSYARGSSLRHRSPSLSPRGRVRSAKAAEGEEEGGEGGSGGKRKRKKAPQTGRRRGVKHQRPKIEVSSAGDGVAASDEAVHGEEEVWRMWRTRCESGAGDTEVSSGSHEEWKTAFETADFASLPAMDERCARPWAAGKRQAAFWRRLLPRALFGWGHDEAVSSASPSEDEAEEEIRDGPLGGISRNQGGISVDEDAAWTPPPQRAKDGCLNGGGWIFVSLQKAVSDSKSRRSAVATELHLPYPQASPFPLSNDRRSRECMLVPSIALESRGILKRTQTVGHVLRELPADLLGTNWAAVKVRMPSFMCEPALKCQMKPTEKPPMCLPGCGEGFLKPSLAAAAVPPCQCCHQTPPSVVLPLRCFQDLPSTAGARVRARGGSTRWDEDGRWTKPLSNVRLPAFIPLWTYELRHSPYDFFGYEMTTNRKCARTSSARIRGHTRVRDGSGKFEPCPNRGYHSCPNAHACPPGATCEYFGGGVHSCPNHLWMEELPTPPPWGYWISIHTQFVPLKLRRWELSEATNSASLQPPWRKGLAEACEHLGKAVMQQKDARVLAWALAASLEFAMQRLGFASFSIKPMQVAGSSPFHGFPAPPLEICADAACVTDDPELLFHAPSLRETDKEAEGSYDAHHLSCFHHPYEANFTPRSWRRSIECHHHHGSRVRMAIEAPDERARPMEAVPPIRYAIPSKEIRRVIERKNFRPTPTHCSGQHF